jgi:alkaline phosphatase D
VPLSIVTGGDSWASGDAQNGFENELFEIVEFVLEHEIHNLVWITTDVHFAQALSYDPDQDGVTDFHEAAVGPIGAVPLVPEAIEIGPSLNPTSLYRGGGFFNFGLVEVDENGETLTFEIRDENNGERFSKTIAAR